MRKNLIMKKENTYSSLVDLFMTKAKRQKEQIIKEKPGSKCPVCFKFVEGKTDSEVLCSTCFGVYEVHTYDDIRRL